MGGWAIFLITEPIAVVVSSEKQEKNDAHAARVPRVLKLKAQL
jgi:hypothetical protein